MSYGSRYQPQMEPAEVMSMREGSLIVFSHGLRHVAQDSRAIVLTWLPRMPEAPEIAVVDTAEASTASATEKANQEARTFW